jgi:hypothetical protein
MKCRRIDENGDPRFGRGAGDFLRDHEAVVQNVETRLGLNRGDWFLDTDAGVPWFGQADAIMGSRETSPDGRAAIKATILDTEGVSALDRFAYGYNRTTRRQTFTADVRTIYDLTATIEVSP